MPEWTLRRAVMDDVAPLVRCIDAAYAVYADKIDDLPPVSEGVAEEITQNIVFVCEQQDRVIAGLFLVAGPDCLKVANLAVHPTAGGQGLGRALMAKAEAEALERGFRLLRLSTHVDMPGNVMFYEHLGWIERRRAGNKVEMTKNL